MHTLTLRNIPEPLFARLKDRAERHRRSLNNELLQLMEEVLLPQTIDDDPFLKEMERFHASFSEPLPDIAHIAKREGRLGES